MLVWGKSGRKCAYTVGRGVHWEGCTGSGALGAALQGGWRACVALLASGLAGLEAVHFVNRCDACTGWMPA